jgi:hypothetical protein
VRENRSIRGKAKMDFKSFVDIAQIATAMATLLTLIALLYQLVLLKRQILTNNQLSVMQDERDIWQLAIEDVKAREGLVTQKFSSDNPANAASENLIISMLFDHYERIFYQDRHGVFPEELWPSWESHIAKTISLPMIYVCWVNSKHIFWTEFVDHFDPQVQHLAGRK